MFRFLNIGNNRGMADWTAICLAGLSLWKLDALPAARTAKPNLAVSIGDHDAPSFFQRVSTRPIIAYTGAFLPMMILHLQRFAGGRNS